MANPIWLGGASSIAQVMTLTPGGTPEVGDLFLIPVLDQAGTTQITLSVAATGTTVAQVVADIVAAWNASTNAYLTPVTATNSTTHVTLTADTAGVPFYLGTVTTTESNDDPADDQTFASATTTANSHSGDWNVATNWSTGAVPVSTDSVTIDKRGASYPIIYGLNQSAVTLASLKIVTGHPAIGTSSFALKISATDARVNLPANDGSTATPAFVNLDLGSVATDCTVEGGANTPTSTASALAGVCIAGSNASNSLVINGGVVWVGRTTVGQSCNFPTIDVNRGTLVTGTATAWTTVTNKGGTVELEQGSTSGTLDNLGGETTITGSTKVGTINAEGGTVYPNQRLSGGDIGDLNMDGGAVDFREETAAVTVDTLTWLKGGGTIYAFNDAQVTYTAIAINDAGATQVTVQMS